MQPNQIPPNAQSLRMNYQNQPNYQSLAMHQQTGRRQPYYNSNQVMNTSDQNYYQQYKHSPATVLPFEQSPQPIGLSPMNAVRTPYNMSMPSPLMKIDRPSPQAPSPIIFADTKNSEDLEYANKLKQLSRYVDPLRKLIYKIEKEDNQKKEIVKLKALLDILSNNSAKRVPLATLLKCEVVLARQFDSPQTDTKQSYSNTSSPYISQIGTPQSVEMVTTNNPAYNPQQFSNRPLPQSGNYDQSYYNQQAPQKPLSQQQQQFDLSKAQYSPQVVRINEFATQPGYQNQQHQYSQQDYSSSPYQQTSPYGGTSQLNAQLQGGDLKATPTSNIFKGTSNSPTAPTAALAKANITEYQANQQLLQQQTIEGSAIKSIPDTQQPTQNISAIPTLSYSEAIREAASKLYSTLEKLRNISENSKEESARISQAISEMAGPTYYTVFREF